MITPLDSKILDINSASLGVSVEQLMENAGKSLADVISESYPEKKILFVCGTGNNGGDGFVAARILSADCAIISEPKTELAKKQYRKIRKVRNFNENDLKDYDVIADCVLGTGVHGDVKQPYSDCIDAINRSGKTIVSCDVPSGFGADKTVKPDITVTFHDVKEGMTEDNCGKIIVSDIGIPDEAASIVGRGDMLRYPVPKDSSHKGQNGRLLIIGGGPYIGAPGLAGLAALRIGADLVHIATPTPSFSGIASMSPNFIMHKLEGNYLCEKSLKTLLELSENVDSVLIGPGLGLSDETKDTVKKFAESCRKPMVIDADGITAIAKSGIRRKYDTVFTPHHSEYRKLAGDAVPEKTASSYNAVIVLKGKEDVITDGARTRRNITGTPAMTVGGTGDVLSGAISGLLSKGMSAFDAGCLGAYICGRSGELAFEEFSYGMLATDVAEYIAKVLKKEIE